MTLLGCWSHLNALELPFIVVSFRNRRYNKIIPFKADIATCYINYNRLSINKVCPRSMIVIAADKKTAQINI